MANPLKLSVVVLFGIADLALGQQLTFNYFGINAAIRDRDPTGLANVQTISASPDFRIDDLNVTLSISGTGFGGFNGDLYATLQHESGFAVLLNRPGARNGYPSGYSDNGINITLDDSALGDIHQYRLVLNGDDLVPVQGALTGSWSADGRHVDPGLVLDSSPRTDKLVAFNGTPLNGTWTLFVSDLGTGGTHQLNGWSIQATVSTIPEPSSLALLLGAVPVIGLCFYSWKRSQRRDAVRNSD
jgi:hypothetical protein